MTKGDWRVTYNTTGGKQRGCVGLYITDSMHSQRFPFITTFFRRGGNVTFASPLLQNVQSRDFLKPSPSISGTVCTLVLRGAVVEGGVSIATTPCEELCILVSCLQTPCIMREREQILGLLCYIISQKGLVAVMQAESTSNPHEVLSSAFFTRSVILNIPY